MQVLRDQVIESVLTFLRGELLHQGQPLGVGDIRRDLTAQGTMTDGLEPRLESLEHLLLVEIDKLFTEALQVAKDVFINETHQAEQLQQRILQRRSGEQQLVLACQRHFESFGDHIRRLVDITQPMGFVNYYQIPWNRLDILSLALGELIGTDNDFWCLKRPKLPLLDGDIVGFSFKDAAGQEEFFGELLKPLLTEVGRGNDENTPFAFRPLLRKYEASLNGFAKANLIRQQGTLR